MKIVGEGTKPAPAEDDRTVMVVSYPPSIADLTATKAFPRPKF